MHDHYSLDSKQRGHAKQTLFDRVLDLRSLMSFYEVKEPRTAISPYAKGVAGTYPVPPAPGLRGRALTRTHSVYEAVTPRASSEPPSLTHGPGEVQGGTVDGREVVEGLIEHMNTHIDTLARRTLQNTRDIDGAT